MVARPTSMQKLGARATRKTKRNRPAAQKARRVVAHLNNMPKQAVKATRTTTAQARLIKSAELRTERGRLLAKKTTIARNFSSTAKHWPLLGPFSCAFAISGYAMHPACIPTLGGMIERPAALAATCRGFVL